MAAEKQYKYTAKFTQPQKVGTVKLEPKGGIITEREYKAIKKDAYGASLLEKGLLVVGDVETTSVLSPDSSGNTESDTIPDFDEAEGN